MRFLGRVSFPAIRGTVPILKRVAFKFPRGFRRGLNSYTRSK
jgi:hypothetical protein